MNKGLGKGFFLFFLYFYCIVSTYATSTLLGEKNWQTVLLGSLLSKPEPTSYGYIAISEGRFINAFSEKGSILWQNSLFETGKGFCSSMNGDFVFVAIEKKLYLINTSGKILWTIQTQKPIIEKPLPGWDGRVFVREENAISSYNLNGICRFRLEVSQGRDFPLMTLNDGSLLYIQQKMLDGKSTALHISPFGTIIEEIIFIDKIISAKESEEGILLGLENGNLALCQIKNEHIDTIWSVKIEKSIQDIFPWNNYSLIQTNEGNFILLDNEKKDIVWEKKGLEKNKIENYVFDENIAILLSKNQIISLDTEGIVHKNIQLETFSSFSSLTKTGFFLEAKNDWSIIAYRIATLEQKQETAIKIPSRRYSISQTKNIELFQNAQTILTSENIFDKEADILARLRLDIHDVQKSYVFTYVPNIFFNSLLVKVSSIEIASYLGTTEAIDFFTKILEEETDQTIIFHCLKAIQKTAYDYDMQLLFAIEKRLSNRLGLSENILQEYIYTITEICRFIGRKAIILKGKNLLTSFLDPKYSVSLQNTARNCLAKIIDFEN